MCFIKTVYNLQKPIKSFIPIDQPVDFSLSKESNHETPTTLLRKHNVNRMSRFVDHSKQSSFLDQLANKLRKNQQEMNLIHKTINQCEQTLDDLMMEMNSTQLKDEHSAINKENDLQTLNSFCESNTTIKEETSSNELTRQLFGIGKKYRYRLDVVGQFDNVIFKERNIKLEVQLKTLDGKVVKNSNIVNLCLALADDNGTWVALNRVGDPMLKGKTQVELYHGQAEFNKIYTKDISRTFPNGRLNIVVYAKPSMLIYDGLTTQFEEHVQDQAIEPLVIGEVVIKAKKKY